MLLYTELRFFLAELVVALACTLPRPRVVRPSVVFRKDRVEAGIEVWDIARVRDAPGTLLPEDEKRRPT